MHSGAHLSEEQLARFQDGEFSPAEAAHLDDCAECAGRLRGLSAAAAAYAEYRDSIRAPLLPPPPKPWRSLDQLVAGHEANRRRTVLRWWVPALAAAIGLVLVIVAMLRPAGQASARANQLLARSALVSLPRNRMISMRAHGRRLLRPAVLSSDGLASDPEMAHLQMLFQAARYGWREPLSSRTFQAWRSQQKIKTDSVSTLGGPGEKRLYRVRTEVPAGVLRSASLTLEAEDLRPTGGDFEFENEGPVAMEEAGPAVAPEAPAPMEAASRPRPAAKEPAVETPVGPADTLRVLAALDEIGADSGEPLDVSPDARNRRVVVRAGGLTPERQQQIAQALAPLPRVTLDLESGSRSLVPLRPAAPQSSSSSIPPTLRQRFEERLGGPVAVQEVTDRTLEASALTLARSHAMEVLARNFPPETEARLSAPDRLLLRRLRQHHIAEMERSAAQVRTALGPVLDAAAAAPPPVGDNERGQTWQAGIPSLVASARETDQLLNRLLAGSYSQSSGEDMLRGLAPAIERLEWAIQSQVKGQ